MFLRTSDATPAAPRGERVAQWVLALATTALVFSSTQAPPLLFLVMPMFAWLGYRGTLREATGVLLVVAAVATEATALGFGPVDALSTRYGLPAELVDAYLQVFLLDCALVLLPLSVAVAHQRRAAAEAVRGRDTLARIVDSATGTAIVVTDLRGRVTVFNPGAETILGRRAPDVVGQPADSLLDPAELGRLGAELGARAAFPDVCAALVGSEGPPRPWQFVHRGGDLRTLQVTVTALRDADGAMSGYLTTGEDVTERERARAALLLALDDREAAVQRLRALDRTRKNLLSTVSHELRTPITSILGYTEMLEDGMAGALAPRQSVMLGRVTRNSHRLLDLVENLITLSKAEAHNLRSAPARCDLVAVARAAYAPAEPAARARGVDLAFATDDARVELWGDADQLRADAGQPPRQRGQVHRGGRPGRPAGSARPATGRARGRGHRHRHPRRRARPGLRPVLPLLTGPGPRDPGHRARAVDREGDRRPAPRHGHRGLDPRVGQPVRGDGAAGGPGRRPAGAPRNRRDARAGRPCRRRMSLAADLGHRFTPANGLQRARTATPCLLDRAV